MDNDIDVVVLTWNDGEKLQLCLDRIVESVGADFSVTVIDNGSIPAARYDDPRVTIIRNEKNEGVSKGRNKAVNSTGAPFICVVDSDVLIEPNALAVLKQGFTEGVGVVVPTFVGMNSNESAGVAPGLAIKLKRALNKEDQYKSTGGFVDGVREVEFALLACMMVRRSCWELVGGLDESIAFGPEDVIFCLEMRANGWKVVQLERSLAEHSAKRNRRNPFTLNGFRHTWALAKYLVKYRRHRKT